MPTAFKGADILLPNKDIDMTKWAVVACDQYTSEPKYWNEVSSIVGDMKSTLNLILPEVYLEDEDVDSRIENIHENMAEYVNSTTFTEYKNSLIYIERTQDNGKVRCGLVGKIDLDEYDFSKGSKSTVRATEATVIERIPPRIKVRQGAGIELPHIMILIDDTDKTVIEPLADNKSEFTKVYDFDLMRKGGHLAGYIVNEALQQDVFDALDNLSNLDDFNKKYALNESSVLLYAMGDGNHSLATAKEFYEQMKKSNHDKDLSNHPARYALVELVNLHSPALEFEAIHRICTEVDSKKLVCEMAEELELSQDKSEQRITIVENGVEQDLYIHKPTSKLTVGSLQNFLDKYLANNGGKVDYIHGAEVISELSKKPNSIGFLLPDMKKEELFPTVILDGSLPRKTFSMGHSHDKRFYVEARKIKE